MIHENHKPRFVQRPSILFTLNFYKFQWGFIILGCLDCVHHARGLPPSLTIICLLMS
jgi:hypothetical protein